jgi:hypothetical protein
LEVAIWIAWGVAAETTMTAIYPVDASELASRLILPVESVI